MKGYKFLILILLIATKTQNSVHTHLFIQRASLIMLPIALSTGSHQANIATYMDSDQFAVMPWNLAPFSRAHCSHKSSPDKTICGEARETIEEWVFPEMQVRCNSAGIYFPAKVLITAILRRHLSFVSVERRTWRGREQEFNDGRGS